MGGMLTFPARPFNFEQPLMKLVTSVVMSGTYDLKASVVNPTFMNCDNISH